jgi:hypothetical protein
MSSSGMLRRVALVKNRRFRGKYRLHHQGDKNREAKNNVSSNYQLTLFLTRRFLSP